MMRYCQLIEIIGTALILISLSIEFVFKKPLDESISGYRTFQIEQRLDNIWGLISHQYSNNPSNKTEVITKFNYDYAARNWPYLRGEESNMEVQQNFLTNFSFGMFMLGSILMLGGKILEWKLKAEPAG